MQRLLGIAPGSVTPLAAINASPGSIGVVLDAGLAAEGRVNVHPLRNTGTLGLSGAAILDLLRHWGHRSEEHTSELQSLMRISYAVFCLKKKITQHNQTNKAN